MPTRLFVTGFGPFGPFDVNPTSVLAPQLSGDHAVLPVTYAAVDDFLDRHDFLDVEAWLMLGVRANAETILLETTARNRIGATPDADGVAAGPMPVDPTGPPQQDATLWTAEHHLVHMTSQHAGEYLCNYLFYQALSRLPMVRIGFVHVPPFSVISETSQLKALRELAATL